MELGVRELGVMELGVMELGVMELGVIKCNANAGSWEALVMPIVKPHSMICHSTGSKFTWQISEENLEI